MTATILFIFGVVLVVTRHTAWGVVSIVLAGLIAAGGVV